MPKTERALVAALIREFKRDGVACPTWVLKEYARLTSKSKK
jgi:hypothetical protein